MKKILFAICMIAAIWSTSLHYKAVNNSDIALDNIKALALANSETPGLEGPYYINWVHEHKVICYTGGYYDCPEPPF